MGGGIGTARDGSSPNGDSSDGTGMGQPGKAGSIAGDHFGTYLNACAVKRLQTQHFDTYFCSFVCLYKLV